MKTIYKTLEEVGIEQVPDTIQLTGRKITWLRYKGKQVLMPSTPLIYRVCKEEFGLHLPSAKEYV